MDTFIFWNHLGREHGGLAYTSDIRKNSPQVVKESLSLKEKHYRNKKIPNIFIRYDNSTLIEHSPPESEKNYIIVYSIDRGLQFSLNYKTGYSWWLVDIVNIQEVRPNVFCVHDLFIDIAINIDGSYKVLDIDEFNTAIRLNIFSKELMIQSFESLHSILSELNLNSFPNKLLIDIEGKYSKVVSFQSNKLEESTE
ncbi:MAG: hypothetical protein ABWX61_02230 [Paenisporosarcina sp.]